MRKITADWVFPIANPKIKEGVVIIDDNGKILAIESKNQHNLADLEVYSGFIIPGFINTHCHLELSHMKGKVNTGTGLIPFISSVVTQRNALPEKIAEAIESATKEMLEGGIVALGDISNTIDTFEVKEKGQMRYYTFVEMFDFLQEDGAEKAFKDWKMVYDKLNLAQGSKKTIVPHAPYSVSKNLFQKINESNPKTNATISIHNQETPPESELFLQKKGGFLDFYSKFGISLKKFKATKMPSIYYAMSQMNPENRTLFVHNTLTTRDDIRAAQAWSPHTYWASCPNANLYIENRLPDYQAFLDTNARVTLGTDSLTSNWQLSILEEMKTIARFQSYVPFETLLRWATLNGAEALGFEDTLGSLEVGKTPGILVMDGVDEDWKIGQSLSVKRKI
jgi:aminodeoxyfutalosine deaminase